MENLNRLKRDYAYEEGQKEDINNQLRTGKIWFDIICARNHIVPADSKLRSTNHIQEYFSLLKANPHYVLVLSGANECSNYFWRFAEVSGLALRKDVVWRDSYVAVVDGG